MVTHLLESSIIFHIEKPNPFTLTEIRIIHLALCGFSPEEIAERFFVQINTIYQARKNAAKKTPSGKFSGVLGWVIAHGIFTSVGKGEGE